MSAQPEREDQANPWEEYERRKKAIPTDLSPAERDQQLRKIADELGI